MSSGPLLSVLIPNYNHAHYLRDVLGDIGRQSFDDYEVIVVDDGSTDHSRAVIEEFARRDDRIKLLCNDRNRGANFTVSRALALASGRYLSVPSADNRVFEGFFAACVPLLEAHAGAPLCLTDPAIFSRDDLGDLRRFPLHLLDEPGYISADEFRTRQKRRAFDISPCASILRRSALDSIGGFRPAHEMYTDWFVTAVLSFRHGLCYVPRVLTAQRLQRESFSARPHADADRFARIVAAVVDDLQSPEFADIYPAVRDSAFIARMGREAFRLIDRDARHRDIITALARRRVLMWTLREALRAHLPKKPLDALAALARRYAHRSFRRRET